MTELQPEQVADFASGPPSAGKHGDEPRAGGGKGGGYGYRP